MSTPPKPTFSDINPWPSRSLAEPNYDIKADLANDSYELFHDELAVAIPWFEDTRDRAEDAATTAENAATSATAAAHYQGDYDAGTLYAIGESVTYSGDVYQKKSTAAAGTTPIDGSDWRFVPQASTPGLEFITSADISNAATADFTAFDATKYDAYHFVLSNVTPATDNVTLCIRTSADGGSTFDSGATDYYSAVTVRDTSFSSNGYEFDTVTLLLSNGVGSDVGEDGVSGSLFIYGPHLLKETCLRFSGVFKDDGNRTTLVECTSIRQSADVVDAIRFYFDRGDIESGTITMYGMVNA